MSDPSKSGRFLLHSRIAVGATAEVFLASPTSHDLGLPNQIVVKRMLPAFAKDPEGQKWFEHEGAILRAIDSPRVVKVFEVGIFDEGEAYLVLEHVDGVDLERLIARLKRAQRPVPTAVALYIGKELVRALGDVHAARGSSTSGLGLVHRDVSPANVYLSKVGDVKLGDFGIAISDNVHAKRSTAKGFKGKLGYLSPEQVAEGTLDGRSDLFSACVILTELLIGTPLFGGAAQLSVLLAIREGNLVTLDANRDALPPGLYDVLKQGLAKNPSARFQTAEELVAALSRFSQDETHEKEMLADLVVELARMTPSVGTMSATRSSTKIRAVTNMREFARSVHDSPTQPIIQIPSWIHTEKGRLGPWSYAEVVEAILTQKVERSDRVEFMGGDPKPLVEIPELLRFLPREAKGELPALSRKLQLSTMIEMFAFVEENEATGVAIVVGNASASLSPVRKEFSFIQGKLAFVTSTDATELLGEFLVRKGQIRKDELEVALSFLPRYGGRIGDTLIALGHIGALDLLRAIREQGKERAIGVFAWTVGRIEYFKREVSPPELSLDLETPYLTMAALERLPLGAMPIDPNGRYVSIGRPKHRERWPKLSEQILDHFALPTSFDSYLKSSQTLDEGAGQRLFVALRGYGYIKIATP